MSAISPTSQTIHSSDQAAPAVPPLEIDASCRAPLLFMFASAAVWLVIASILGFIASLKFHAPNLLAANPWLTYGRVHPAALDSLVYGFAVPAGLGVGLWLLCHLGRTKLAHPALIGAGALLWNLGVTVGAVGILAGDSTGFEWLEMPRYSSMVLFFAYAMIGIGGVLTFHQRRERSLYISQLFILAALFWFPWIYSTANLLLVIRPVRGVMQPIIAWWYAGNLTTIWLGFIGIATIFYFLPKIAQRPLHSNYLGIFAFWTLAFFGSWGNISAGTPLPEWIPAVSMMAAVLTIVPVLAVAVNCHRAVQGQYSKLTTNPVLAFIIFGALSYVFAGLLGALATVDEVAEVVGFTWFLPAQAQLALCGFFVLTMFGAIYYIVPRLTQAEFSSAGVRLHLWLAILGVVLYVVPLLIGGLVQGHALNQTETPVLDVLKSTLTFFRVSTTGELLMVLGNLIFLLNIFGLLNRVSRASMTAFLAGNAKAAGVAS
jgi:cytochrome c oxidase cbb3-type subunit 1